jgi:hypothetical protein
MTPQRAGLAVVTGDQPLIALRHAPQPRIHRKKISARMVQRNGNRDWIRQTPRGTEQHSR